MPYSTRHLALALALGTAGGLAAVDQPSPAPLSPAGADDPFADYADSMYSRDFGDVRWGGYGELHYNNWMGNGKASQLDLHRLIFLAEYSFNEQISFFSEIEIEHALVKGGSKSGELETEQAYVDFKVHEQAAVKAGIVLVPFSIMNLYHEPPLFYGVERPSSQGRVVPTTWFEPGVSVYGDISEQLSYELAVQAGLDATGFSSAGLRGGRQKAYNSKAEDLMVTARLDYRPLPGLWIAGAVNSGSGVQDPESDVDGNVTLYTLEARYRWEALTTGLSWTQGFISDAEELSTLNGSTVAESIHALELFAGYDVAPLFSEGTWSLEPFARFEIIDTQAEIPDGFTEDESQTGTVLTVGVVWKPIERIAIKADYQDVENDADTGVDMFNAGIGWMF